MIKKESFDLVWIKTFNEKPQRANPEIIEKEIYALKLLELLVETGLDFIFKGGTCLSLILQEFTRFSIDIDITTNIQETDIDQYLSKLKYEDTFTNFKEQERNRKGKLIKRHYKFFYDSQHYNGKEEYVLLDIVFEDTHYHQIENTKIDFLLLQSEEPYLTVKTPSLNNILVDKLTAFAPETIGITYETEKYMEIIKQMYDVSKISKKIHEKDIDANLYKTLAAVQIENRMLNIDYKDTLLDTIYTTLNILTKGFYSKDKYEMLERAINGFRGYVYGNKFTQNDAEDVAIDALYVATIILVENLDTFIKNSEESIMVKEIKSFNKVLKYLKGFHSSTGQYEKLENSLKNLVLIGASL